MDATRTNHESGRDPGDGPDASTPQRAFALEVVERLRSRGYQALWAGGCVRDLLLGRLPADYDVATDARPEQVQQLFRRTVAVGASFGVIVVVGGRHRGDVEVATFRSDGAYIDGRRPESVVFSSPEEDALRRDFTINGMFYDPVADRVIDYVGGRDDLEAGVVRAIGDPRARFDEDKLRLLRAVRFAARFGFDLESQTRAAVEAMADLVTVVAAERITHELRKMLEHPQRSKAMRMTLDVGLLGPILPRVDAMAARETDWRITLDALERLGSEVELPLALATLLNRIDSGETTLEQFADDLARDLRLSNAERTRLTWLVSCRNVLVEAPNLAISTLKRILAEPGIDDLIRLHEVLAWADDRSSDHVVFVRNYLCSQPDGPIDPPPLITGRDLIALGLKPGPHFAALLDRVRDAQLENGVTTPDQARQLALCIATEDRAPERD